MKFGFEYLYHCPDNGQRSIHRPTHLEAAPLEDLLDAVLAKAAAIGVQRFFKPAERSAYQVWIARLNAFFCHHCASVLR